MSESSSSFSQTTLEKVSEMTHWQERAMEGIAGQREGGTDEGSPGCPGEQKRTL